LSLFLLHRFQAVRGCKRSDEIDATENMPKKLLTDEELVAVLAMSNVTTRTIARWRRSKKIPVVRLGYRSLFYDPDKVVAALAKHEVRAIGTQPMPA
jgi:hypothetical protein